MSVLDTIYNALEGNVDLRNLLAPSTINPNKKAIYDEWATNDTSMPYLVYTLSFSEGNHWGKYDSLLNIDIFTESDSRVAESIRNEVLKTLDRKILTDLDNGAYIRCYYNRDGTILETEENITHWNIEIGLKHWKNDFIEYQASL